MESTEELMCEVDFAYDLAEEKFKVEIKNEPNAVSAEEEPAVTPLVAAPSDPRRSVRAAMRKTRRPARGSAAALGSDDGATKTKTFWCFGAPLQRGCELCFGCCMPLACKKCRVERTVAGRTPATVTYVCRLCGERSADPDAFKAHMRSAHVALECGDCGKSFPNTTRLKNHMKTHESKRYLCEKCSSSFKRLDQYKTHCIRKHTDGKAFACRECGKPWKTKGDLMQHMRSHRRKATAASLTAPR